MKSVTVKTGPLQSVSAATDAWLFSRLNFLVVLVMITAFGLRLRAALGTYLNPDEALHFLLANQPSFEAAYRASQTNAHPPLYFLLLYFWRFLGTSEVMLRLPAVVAGAGVSLVSLYWLRTAMGITSGVVAMLLIAFSPPLIALSAEVRGYSLLLLWLAAALYFLERAFREKSTTAIVFFSLFLYLAILTEYSALWFALAAGIYVLLRIRELPRRTAAVWAAFQVGAVALYGLLYFTHIVNLRGGGMEAEAMDGWLRASYFRPGEQSLVAFLVHNTRSVFDYLFAGPLAGLIAMLLTGASVIWIISQSARKTPEEAWQIGALLILPFILNAGAAVARVYPYGGSRHCVYLVLFATAGVAYMIAKAAGQRLLLVLLTAAVLLPLWHRSALPPPQQMDPQSQRLDLMTEAMAYLRQSASPDSLIFTDEQSRGMLSYELGRNQVAPPETYCGHFHETIYGQFRVVSYLNWNPPASQFLQEIAEWRKSCHPAPLKSIWVFDGGWGENLLDDLDRVAPRIPTNARRFGNALSVFQLEGS